MYEFKYALNDEDYLDYNLYFYYNTKFGKRVTRMGYLLFPLITVAVTVVYWIADKNVNTLITNVIMFSIFNILYFSFFKKFFKRGLKRNLKKQKKYGKLPYSQNGVIRFYDDKIVDTSERSETSSLYSTVENIGITDNMIYIFIDTQVAYMIPVNSFENEKQKLEFLEFLNSKVKIEK